MKAATDPDGVKLTEVASRIKDDAVVEVTGILHWYQSPPVPAGMNPEFYQRAPNHFYFDFADARIKVVTP